MIFTKGQFRVGTSGYRYDHWRDRFYPHDLSKKDWFAHYAKHFDTVEINTSFYGLPSAETFDVWRKQAPTGFCYALKFSRYGSHVKRLKVARTDSCPTAAELGCKHRSSRRIPQGCAALGPLVVRIPRSPVAVRRGVCHFATAQRRPVHPRHDRESSQAHYRRLDLFALPRRPL
jgi:uncharacterized protein YecE (DUF72 family)